MLKSLSILAGILLLLGIPTGWPYSYYVMLRIIIFISAIIIAVNFYPSKWEFIYALIACLFNPIFPIYLNKTAWVPIDFIAAILYLTTALSISLR